MASVKLSVDRDAELAYIKLSEAPVASTIEHDECVLVDLDAMRVAVGIELLDLDAKIPFDELTTNYHVSSDVVDTLRLIQPTINGFVVSYLTINETPREPARVPSTSAHPAFVTNG